MEKQTTDKVLMIRPVDFGFNSQTSENNAFQQEGYSENAQENALKEFDNYVDLLVAAGVEVIAMEDTPPVTPDSIFPNNWFSTHPETLVLYPMFAPNRRLERKPHVINRIEEEIRPTCVINLSHYENDDKFLEGTGSMILDRIRKIAYVCRSPRSNKEVLEDFCRQMEYEYIFFNASDSNDQEIYHTNVMMSVGTDMAIICLDSIKNIVEREVVIESLENSGKKIFEISLEQMSSFAGNMLELSGKNGEKILVMSLRAYNSLTQCQQDELKAQFHLITPDLNYIELNGGGSARCMLAEIFS